MKAIFPTILTAAKIAALPLVCMALSGCIDDKHYIHRDFISEVAGDDIAVNAATQTENPWPKESRNAKINVDAKRLETAVRCYREDKSLQPQGLSTSDSINTAQSTSQPDSQIPCSARRLPPPAAAPQQ
jgi:hypothetical protein